MSLTLERFRELTENMPPETVINTTVEFGKEWSIRGTINCIHICPKEHTHSADEHITLTQCKGDKLVVKRLVDKNKWVVDNQ